MESTYTELKIDKISRSIEEALSNELWGIGADGLSENLEFSQNIGEYNPQPKINDTFSMTAYFKSKVSISDLKDLEFKYPGLEFKLSEEQEKDWLAEWKKGYKSFELVGPYWIYPSWEKLEDPSRKVIWIDPGMAFGTGTHETTQLASKGIWEVLRNCNVSKALDVGTGTGLLAFLLSKEGVSEVVGTEIDNEACEVAIKNAEFNNVSMKIENKDLGSINGSYDLVVANIIDGVLLKLKSDIFRLCRSGGHIVLSGILKENEVEFLEGFFEDQSQVKVLNKMQKGEWLGIVAQKQ